MEGCLQNKSRLVQASCDVLWLDKLASLLRELVNEGHVVIYLDDILIFTETLEEHHRIVARVLEILEKNKLYLKPEKCDFDKKEIEYLGVIISHNSMRMDPVKIAGI